QRRELRELLRAEGRSVTGFDGGRFPDRLPEAFTTPGSSSFVEFVRSYVPQLLPGYGLSGHAADRHGHIDAPHGTTIVALTHAGGMVMAGDRRATMGSTIAHRRMEKVVDRKSVVEGKSVEVGAGGGRNGRGDAEEQ